MIRVKLIKKLAEKICLKKRKKEIKIINSFLPKQMSEEETKNICEKVIERSWSKIN